jgi:hypothetical protein
MPIQACRGTMVDGAADSSRSRVSHLWDRVEDLDQVFVCRSLGHSQISGDFEVGRVPEPFGVLRVAAGLVAFSATRHHVLLGARTAIFPQHEVIHGQRNVVSAAISASIAVALEHLPRDVLIDLALALAHDGLGDRAVSGFRQNFGFERRRRQISQRGTTDRCR